MTTQKKKAQPKSLTAAHQAVATRQEPEVAVSSFRWGQSLNDREDAESRSRYEAGMSRGTHWPFRCGG